MPRGGSTGELERDEDDDSRMVDDQDGYEAPPMPPLGPDGGPILEPAPLWAPTPAGQGLCSDGPGGPCRNYHAMVTAIDAQQPIGRVVAENDEHLTLAADDSPAPEAEQELHTCYPAPGIEYDLGDRYVYSCNRYAPLVQIRLPNGDLAALGPGISAPTPPTKNRPEYTVRCPWCHAGPGEHCVLADGTPRYLRTAEGPASHDSRILLAIGPSPTSTIKTTPPPRPAPRSGARKKPRRAGRR